MTSKDIVTRLIDEKLISGEEAYTLINDLVQAEMVATMKLLKESDVKSPSINTPYWVYPSTISSTGSTGITVSGNASSCTIPSGSITYSASTCE